MHSSRRPVRVRDAVEDLRFDLAFGPYFDELGVQLLGPGFSRAATALPIAPNPRREVVLSETFARRLFSTPDQAVGRTLSVGSIAWMLGDESAWVDYEIVGVALQPFAGTNIERSPEFWMGVNGWHGVLFPAHQIEDVRRHFSAATLVASSQDPAGDAVQIQAALRRAGEPAAHVSLVKGVGYHPTRRQRFESIGRSLLMSAASISMLSLLGLVAFSLLRTEQRRDAQHVRAMLGEPPLHRLVRQLAGALGSLTRIAAALAAGLTVFAWTAADQLPIAALLDRLLLPVLLAFAGVSAWIITTSLTGAVARVSRPVAARLSQGRAHLLSSVSALLVLAVIVAWAAGSVSVLRIQQLRTIDLQADATDVATASLKSESKSWMLDTRSVSALETDLASLGVAMASSGVVGAPIESFRGSYSLRGEQVPAVLMFNHVSANFFATLGASAQGRCAEDAGFGARSVVANQAFLRSHGIGEADLPLTIQRDGTDEMLQLCGWVGDFHVLDARAGLAPMLYRRIQERRFLGVLLASAETPAGGEHLESVLQQHFSDTRVEPWSTVQAQLDSQLVQERALTLINLILIGLAALMCLLSSMLLASSIVTLNLRAIATRRALGASRIWLAVGAVSGGRALPWLAMLPLGAAVIHAAMQWSNAAPVEAAISLSLAVLVAALVMAAAMLLSITRVSDRRLLGALRSD